MSSKKQTTKIWRNPFKSFLSSGRKRNSNQSEFASYDLSQDESIYVGNLNHPMKEVPENHKKILMDGKRENYLTIRWDISPDSKYNFPEATSWRYGWIHSVRSKASY